jgi:gas vesicle protein
MKKLMSLVVILSVAGLLGCSDASKKNAEKAKAELKTAGEKATETMEHTATAVTEGAKAVGEEVKEAVKETADATKGAVEGAKNAVESEPK